MEIEDNKRKKSNSLWILATILLLYFIYFIPKEIAYPEDKTWAWFGYILIFIVLPFLVNKIIKTSNKNFSSIKTKGICALSILIVGPTFAIFQDYRENYELKVNGKITECIVIDRKPSKNDWLINCKYQVQKVEYITYFHTDEENKYRIGDTLKLIYNKEYPRMYQIEF
jgi:hypothetical protein